MRDADWSGWIRVFDGKNASIWRKDDRVRRVALHSKVHERAVVRQRHAHVIGAACGAAMPLRDSWLDRDSGDVLRGASFVLEMAAGKPLAIGELRDDAFDLLSVSMLECLARLHDANVIHLDVKPGNFVVLDGEARLIDFESAAVLAADKAHVAMDDVFCTRAFAAPEVLANRCPVFVGRPADAFALGRSFASARQANDESYKYGKALHSMIRGLCREEETTRWTAKRALEHWRSIVQSCSTLVQSSSLTPANSSPERGSRPDSSSSGNSIEMH